MKTVKLIQYVDRFDTKEDAETAGKALNTLDGFVCKRVYETYEKPSWVLQAMFEYHENINHENDELRLAGFRSVICPVSFLKYFDFKV